MWKKQEGADYEPMTKPNPKCQIPNTSPHDDLPYWAAFSYCRNVGSIRLRKIYTHFQTMKAAWEASMSEFEHLNFEQGVLEEIEKKKRELDPDKVWKSLAREGLTVIPFTDSCYPALLKEIYDPPALLYVRGILTSGEHEIRIAVVGTRKMTPYGEQVTEMLVKPLAENGITIISGLAYGIDAKAHETTLNANGKTIAVLGCGLDHATIYPSHHLKLVEQIVDKGGFLASEHAPGTPPMRQHFPHRNRIIAGMSRATLVVEAPEGSGAITTANYALEFNRDVLVVPGNITSPHAWGPNMLLKKGAIPVTQPEDIFAVLNISDVKAALDTKKNLPNTEEELKILNTLTPHDPKHIDAIAKATVGTPAATASALSVLELKGMVRNVGGMRYIRLN